MFATERANQPNDEGGAGRSPHRAEEPDGGRRRPGTAVGGAPPNADVAWTFLDLVAHGDLASALDSCTEDVVLHVDAEGSASPEEVVVTGRRAAGALLARLLPPGGTGRLRKKGLMIHDGTLAVMAATGDRDPVILRFSLEEELIRELWLQL